MVDDIDEEEAKEEAETSENRSIKVENVGSVRICIKQSATWNVSIAV